jgi:hypothetical protein
MEKIVKLAQEAKPMSYDDYGSERQVNAFNAFTIKMEQILSKEDFELFEDYSMKATNEELIDFGIELARRAENTVNCKVKKYENAISLCEAKEKQNSRLEEINGGWLVSWDVTQVLPKI